MRTVRDNSLISVTMAAVLAFAGPALPVHAQTAADAALNMANMLDGAGGGVSDDALLAGLETAAADGEPMAMWQLGTMYENGQGVERDPAKAFSYFDQIARQNFDSTPRGSNSDIVAQSLLKLSEYYKQGVPDAGIPADSVRYHDALVHAASYFGDADAQYQMGLLYVEDNGQSTNPLMSYRWWIMAARKGHCGAQGRLGGLLFSGGKDFQPQPVDGLMWLAISHENCAGTADSAWVDDLFTRASAKATPDQRAEALDLASIIGPQLGNF
ncbi:MAG: hypothetical protein ABS76_13490 [Pelagibacterium sp. SCN 64-44]|nr:MAG: hypothetical protein ABS76_13490 [Pelagibacterium sp. SCN 64-44]